MKVKSGHYKILLSAFIWGTMGAFARWSGLNPLELSFFRLLIASLTLYAFLPRDQRLLIFSTQEYFALCLAGILFAGDCVLFFYALKLTTISNAVLPYNMQPLFIAVLAPIFFKEKMDAKCVLAFFVSLIGVAMLVLPPIVRLSYQDVLGIAYSFIGAFLLSVIAVIVKKVHINALTFVYYEMVIAALCLTLFIKITSTVNLRAMVMVLFLGILHTAFAYSLFYDGLKKISTQYALTLCYLTPVIAVLTGFIFFTEEITLLIVTGGLIIIINGILVILKS